MVHTMRADVVIVGGSVVGSSVAWNLRQDGFDGRILVVERDGSYDRASAWRAMGGIRQQFGLPVTVQMVQHSVRLWTVFDQRMATSRHTPRSWFRQRGYLFLADARTAAALHARYEAMRSAGARVQMLTPDAIGKLVPDLVLDDIQFGVYGPEDGYAAPREVLAGFRSAAEACGVEYCQAEVAGVIVRHGTVGGVRLGDGTAVDAEVVVNAAGPWAATVAALAGLDVPVTPVRQALFRARLPHRWPYRFPMVIDPSGLHWRHDDPVAPDDADRIVVAFTKWEEPPGEHFAVPNERWAAEYEPVLKRRLPALTGLSDVEGWAGLYEMTPDHNPLLGEHPAVRGLIFATGFSGHGLMMSPATGAIVSELVRTGRSTTFDISPFAPDRFERGARVHDPATI